MNINEISIDVGATLATSLDDWQINYKLLQKLAATRSRTVGTANDVWQLARDVAEAVNLSPKVVAVILQLEYNFPERTLYRSVATRDDGSTRYRGITQASKPFWLDVVAHAAARGFKISARVPENATLFEQIAAPFIYLDRYRSYVARHLFTPAMIYALHQQGPGAAKKNFARVAGKQSGRSLIAVRAAQQGARGRAVPTYL